MNSFKKSFLFAVIKIFAFLFMLLPIKASLWLGRCLGRLGYTFLGKKRAVVYANLKTIFADTLTPAQIRSLSKNVFINFIQSAVEYLCLPKIKRIGFDKFVDLKDQENIDVALARGKGVILLAIHSGSWEMASVVGGVTKSTYHVVANDQSKLPQLDEMLNEYRTIAGAHVIKAGIATKEIIKAMKNNEVVSLVLDQGGLEGIVVPFFGKTASMSSGAFRLALKYGCAVCPVWIERQEGGMHQLSFFPPLTLQETGDLEHDLRANVSKAAEFFEKLIKEHPVEYMWFYKVFKYSNQARIVIIDDGRTGHLRQSQAIARSLKDVLKKKEKFAEISIVALEWRNTHLKSLFSCYAMLGQYFSFLRREDYLKSFLTDSSWGHLMKLKADYVISCGSKGAGINYILSKNHMAKSISILTPGLMSVESFDAVVLPEHDRPVASNKSRMIIPKVAPNLINAAYLKEQSEGLLKYYSHLKGNVRTKIGVLIGGNTKGVKFDEAQIRQLIEKLKEAALHYNADILLTTSRRTPVEIEQLILNGLKNFERCSLCIIANERNIPEAVGGILDLSDLVIVSGESISMVSEAISSAKNTIVFSPRGEYKEKPRDKYEDFVLKLNDEGYLMVTSIKDLPSKMSQLLSRKIILKTLIDQSIIKSGLEQMV